MRDIYLEIGYVYIAWVCLRIDIADRQITMEMSGLRIKIDNRQPVKDGKLTRGFQCSRLFDAGLCEFVACKGAYRHGIDICIDRGIILKIGRVYQNHTHKLLIEYRRTGLLQSLCRYRYGLKYGITTRYHQSGNIHELIPYKHGEAHGMALNWYNNGQIRYKINFYHGITDGIRKKYTKNGTIKSKKLWKMGTIVP